jgi:hypothetical protein
MLSIFAAARPPELSLGIDVDKCMPIGVADDEAVLPSFMSGSSTDQGGGKRRSGIRPGRVMSAASSERLGC